MGVTRPNRLKWAMMLAAAAALGGGAAAASPVRKAPLPRPRPESLTPLPVGRPTFGLVPLPHSRPLAGGASTSSSIEANLDRHGVIPSGHPTITIKPTISFSSGPFAAAPTTTTSTADLAALKQVIEDVDNGKDADAAEQRIRDPVARKLAEWVILHSAKTHPGFQRYLTFIKANPSWPYIALFRHRAENALWEDGVDDATVLAFFAEQGPSSAKGRYALARALLDKGDHAGAAALVRYAWRFQDCSPSVERKVLELFGKLLTREDRRVRMEQRFYAGDVAAALREGHHLGGADLAIARAWAAVIRNARNAGARLRAVPVAARHDPGYIFARARWLRRKGKVFQAAEVMRAAPHEASALIDPDRWWMERRVLVRALLDRHHAKEAFLIARDAVTPERGYYRADKYFTAGWIALRFLHDAKTAAALFAHVAEGTNNRHALARAGYWQGRAADALGEHARAKTFYEAAAKYETTYYGQLARARLGFTSLGLRGPPALTPHQRRAVGNLEIVRAAKLLYALDQRDLLSTMFVAIGKTGTDIAGMTMLAELAAKHNDGRAMVLLGEHAVSRGLPFGYFAFPTVGLPHYKPIAAPIARAVSYSIARQESRFNPKVVSSSDAMGLMQVTPVAGRETARRYKIRFSRHRLRHDPAYNMKVGAATFSHLLHYFDGSYLLAFAAYNAGLGRIRQWIQTYGDPRDPSIDPIDWVERLPFSETRHYVQRVMENLQVYRARFGGGGRLLIEADLRRGEAN